jgi:SAM-dependent methyltransferase
MRNESAWKPTKFVRHGSGWRASRDRAEVAASSRLIGDIVAGCYQDLLERFARGRLVDLGCGKAPLYGIYRSKVDSVVCVDWRHGAHGNDFVDHAMDLNGRLDFPDASFDTVLATDVLEHVREADRLWSEMARICRPRGRLILGTPFLYWIHEDPHDYWRYTYYCLQEKCQRHDLKVLSLQEYGGLPEVLADLLIKCFANRPSLVSPLDLGCRWLLRLPPIRTHSERTRRRFPLGYCLVAEKAEPGSRTGHD